MFLGFGAEECRPDGVMPQRYFPGVPEELLEPDFEQNPFLVEQLPDEAPEFAYSCAFCVAYGINLTRTRFEEYPEGLVGWQTT